MIDAHRAAFEYDWRARFHKPLTVVGRSMSWGEALRLTGILVARPDSEVAVSISEWSHPASFEALALMNLYDLEHRVAAGRRATTYPRPWDKGKRSFGRGTSMHPDEMRALLDRHRGVSRDKRGRLHDAHGRFIAG